MHLPQASFFMGMYLAQGSFWLILFYKFFDFFIATTMNIHMGCYTPQGCSYMDLDLFHAKLSETKLNLLCRVVVDVWPPIACHGGSRGSLVRASAYAELDGERKRQSIYPGSGPRSLIE